jgi:hypothetical protein
MIGYMTITSVPHYSSPLTLKHETCKYIHTIEYLENRYISRTQKKIVEFCMQNATNIICGLRPVERPQMRDAFKYSAEESEQKKPL